MAAVLDVMLEAALDGRAAYSMNFGRDTTFRIWTPAPEGQPEHRIRASRYSKHNAGCTRRFLTP